MTTTFDELADALLVSSPAVNETLDTQACFSELESAILAQPLDTRAITRTAIRLARAAFDALPDTLADTIKAAKDLHAAKNADYGDSFSLSVQKYGFISALTRLSDKANRLAALSNGAARVKDETLYDTYFDAGNYALMTAVEATNYSPSRTDTPAQETPHNPLADTIEGMLSTSSKARFKAEYTQLSIRLKRLCRALDDGTIALACPDWLIRQQADTMKQLAGILETRALLENINIKD